MPAVDEPTEGGAAPVLRLAGITKRFGGLTANDAISLELKAGKILALLGENGAGKTTLMSILFGHYVADEGHIEVFGRRLPAGSPQWFGVADVLPLHGTAAVVDLVTGDVDGDRDEDLVVLRAGMAPQVLLNREVQLTSLAAAQIGHGLDLRIEADPGDVAGLFLGLLTYSSAVSAPFTGAIVDRIGQRRVLIGVSLILAACSTSYAFMNDYRLMLAVVVIHGFFWSGLLSASSAYMTSTIPESRRAEGLGYWGLASVTAIARLLSAK